MNHNPMRLVARSVYTEDGQTITAVKAEETTRIDSAAKYFTRRGQFVYLASPYSQYRKNRLGEPDLDAAFESVTIAAALLVEAGVPVYCPITHSHPIAELGGLDPLDYEIWKKLDAPLVNAASGCLVLMLDGWQESVGVQHEISEFRKAGKPILYLDWDGEDSPEDSE